jgi:hypothetical protein
VSIGQTKMVFCDVLHFSEYEGNIFRFLQESEIQEEAYSLILNKQFSCEHCKTQCSTFFQLAIGLKLTNFCKTRHLIDYLALFSSSKWKNIVTKNSPKDLIS